MGWVLRGQGCSLEVGIMAYSAVILETSTWKNMKTSNTYLSVHNIQEMLLQKNKCFDPTRVC